MIKLTLRKIPLWIGGIYIASSPLVNGLIKISQQRISTPSAWTDVVIPLLHWGSRWGLGVNTLRGLSLSFSAGEKRQWAHLTIHLSSQSPHPSAFLPLPYCIYFFSKFGGSHFSHRNSFFQLIYVGWILALWLRTVALSMHSSGFLFLQRNTEYKISI